VGPPLGGDAGDGTSRSLVTAAVGAFGGEGKVEESAGDLFAVPRRGGEDVAGLDE